MGSISKSTKINQSKSINFWGIIQFYNFSFLKTTIYEKNRP